MNQPKKNQLALQLGLRPVTVTLLFITLVLLILPHIVRLPLWSLAASFIFMLWRFQHERRGWPLPGSGLRIVLILMILVGITISFGNIVGRLPFTTLFITMLGLKFIELRTRRDLMLILFLGYFIVITHFLDNQNIGMAVYMFVVVMLLTTALISFNRKQDIHLNEFKDDFRLSAVMLLQAVPVMLVLFILFPRLSAPMWAIPTDSASAVTGLSDEMSPGQISSLTQSSAIAFRVNFHGEQPDSTQLYWRGPVFVNYDGRRWSKGSASPLQNLQLEETSEPIEYTVTLEANNKPWLLALDMPTHMLLDDDTPYPLNRSGVIRREGIISSNYELYANDLISQRMQYRLISSLQYRTPELSVTQWQEATDVHENIGQNLLDFAIQLRQRHNSDRAVVNAMLAYFKNEEFYYTLQPKSLGLKPMQQFLFDTREGFCEHYASAFTIIMRAAGIPSRVVTGYLSSEINPYGDYLVVRQSDAHAWSEVWLEEEGWVRVDPTAAVAPERIRQGLEALPEFSVSPVLLGNNAALTRVWRTVSRSWDAVNNTWYQLVLGYNYKKQKELLKKFGLGHAHIVQTVTIILFIIGALIAVFSLFMLRPKRKHDTIGTLYNRFCSLMAIHDFPRTENEGPKDYRTRLIAQYPAQASLFTTIISAYIRQRYSQYPSSSAEHRMRNALRRLQKTNW